MKGTLVFPTGVPPICTDPDTGAPDPESAAWTVISAGKPVGTWAGSIVKVSQQPVQADEQGKPVVSLDFVYTPEQIATSVDKAKKDRNQLNLLEHTVPLVGFIVGIPAILIGLGLVIRGPGGRARTS
jgi:hypothetical protein